MHPKELSFPTYVIASNRLAGEFIVDVLAKQHFTRPILCEQLPQPRLKPSVTVFILEGSFVSLPLGECLRRLRFVFPKARFLVVNRGQPDEEIIRLLRLGIHGFVEHSKVAEALPDAVRTVAAGNFWISNELLQSYIKLTTEPRRDRSDRMPSPTPREAEVLELVRQRLSNKEIAKILKVRESTVKYHLSNIMAKFQVGGRRELEIKAKSARVWEELLS